MAQFTDKFADTVAVLNALLEVLENTKDDFGISYTDILSLFDNCTFGELIFYKMQYLQCIKNIRRIILFCVNNLSTNTLLDKFMWWLRALSEDRKVPDAFVNVKVDKLDEHVESMMKNIEFKKGKKRNKIIGKLLGWYNVNLKYSFARFKQSASVFAIPEIVEGADRNLEDEKINDKFEIYKRILSDFVATLNK
jgi:hypothetical protein